MGLIDKLRDKMNNNKNTQQNIQYVRAGMQTAQDGTTINLWKLNERAVFTHRDGRKTKLLTGLLEKTEDGDAIMIDTGTHVAFEIPEGVSFEEQKRKGLLQWLYQNGVLDNIQDGKYNSLGEIVLTDDGWNIFKSSKAVDAYIENLNLEIQQERMMVQEDNNRRIAKYEQERREEEYRRQNLLEREKNQRRQNPRFIKGTDTFYGGKNTESYSTVNMVTGEVIKLKNVEKLGIDPSSNMYLYTAKMLSFADDKGYAEGLLDDEGSPILFATAKKLDEIAKNQNPEEIEQIATLVSVGVDSLNPEEKSYLGQLDYNGRISRRLEDTSKIMRDNIIKLQEGYKKKMEDSYR